MRKLARFISLQLLMALVVFAPPVHLPDESAHASLSPFRLRTVPSLVPIEIGEKAQVIFRWLGVAVAHGSIELKERIKHRGRDAWHVVLNVETTRFLALLFPVQDEYHSFIDVETLQSLRFEKMIREGAYRADEVVEYDHEKKCGYYFSRLNKTEKIFSTESVIHDPISAVYWFRSHVAMSVGKTIEVPVNYEEANWYIRVPMVAKENLEYKEKSLKPSIKMKPYITNLNEHVADWDETQREMLTGSKITVWVEEKGDRVPLKVSIKVPLVGSVKIQVTDYWNPSGSPI